MNPNRPPNCRIFLGNLASEKTSRKELQEIFSKYGEIVEEIVLRRSFGFIQYDNPGNTVNTKSFSYLNRSFTIKFQQKTQWREKTEGLLAEFA